MQIFNKFFCHPQKHFRPIPQIFQRYRVPLKFIWCHQFCLELLSKSGNPDSLPPKEAIFGVVLKQNKFSWPIGRLSLLWYVIHVVISMVNSKIQDESRTATDLSLFTNSCTKSNCQPHFEWRWRKRIGILLF